MIADQARQGCSVASGADDAEAPARVQEPRRFNYGALSVDHANAVQAAAVRIKARTAAAILETGRDLVAVKALLDHGQFGAWLRAEFEMTPRTAQNYIKAAELAQSKSETVSHLPATIVYEIARSPAAVQAPVLQTLASGELHADQVRSILRATIKDHRARRAQHHPAECTGSMPLADAGDTSAIPDADAAAGFESMVAMAAGRLADIAGTVLEATGSSTGSPDLWDSFSRALRLALEQQVAATQRTSIRSWQDVRDTLILSPRITSAHQAFLANLGSRGTPSDGQIAKLYHIAEVAR